MSKKQPKIQIEKRALWQYIDYACIIAALFAIAYTMIRYSELPEQIPIHFNLKGEADSYGSKFYIWFLPVLTILQYMLLTQIARYPHTFNYTVKITKENADRQYTIAVEMVTLLKLCIVIFFTYMTYQTVQIAMNGQGSLGFFSTFLFLGVIAIIIIRTVLQSSKTR